MQSSQEFLRKKKDFKESLCLSDFCPSSWPPPGFQVHPLLKSVIGEAPKYSMVQAIRASFQCVPKT